MPKEPAEYQRVMEELRPAFESDRIEKVNHNLKFDISVLRSNGIELRGKLFDTMVAHSLVEPDINDTAVFQPQQDTE